MHSTLSTPSTMHRTALIPMQLMVAMKPMSNTTSSGTVSSRPLHQALLQESPRVLHQVLPLQQPHLRRLLKTHPHRLHQVHHHHQVCEKIENLQEFPHIIILVHDFVISAHNNCGVGGLREKAKAMLCGGFHQHLDSNPGVMRLIRFLTRTLISRSGWQVLFSR